MIHPAREPQAQTRVMHKAIVFGADTALQTGFLNIASGGTVAYQLYSTAGIGIGVSRNQLPDEGEAVLQLWSLPATERFPGLIQAFMRGHRGAIIVLRPDEVDSLNELYSRLTRKSQKMLLIVIVGVQPDLNHAAEEITRLLEEEPRVCAMDSVASSMKEFAIGLSDRSAEGKGLPLVVLLDENACQPQAPILGTSQSPPNSKSEMRTISEIACSIGAKTTSTHCFLELDEGVVRIDLSMGNVYLEPVICEHCQKKCARRSKICIVGVDTGWSSEDMGGRALLTLAKIYALARRELPDLVEKQLYQACRCSKIELPHDIENMPGIAERLSRLGYIKRGLSWTLLDEAKWRLQEGRLSETDYDSIALRIQMQEPSD
ncbi:MAG: hypothetical protein ACFFD6_07110 [Candidatus Thorarchaeota archaeon]